MPGPAPTPLDVPPWVTEGRFTSVGHFLVGPELGRGGMGVVHEAWDPRLQRRIALKLLRRAEPKAILRLSREAKAQAQLAHPGICQVFEVDAGPDRPHIAMQLVRGPSLGALADSLSLEAKVALLAEVAQAVHAAHEAGLIHRDLKPSNILVETAADGGLHPVVVDFGLALDLRGIDRTLSWGAAGTPAYMSPEQARGEPLTPASDVYGLGATLFALLTGRPPFQAITLHALVTQQARRDAPRLRRLLPRFHRDLDAIVATCLQAWPQWRYPSAQALAQDLRRFLEGLPPTARRVRLPGRIWRRALRQKRFAATLAGAALVMLSLAAWSADQVWLAFRRIGISERFGEQARQVETILRMDHLLPPHDVRPAETRVRATLAGIRAAMGQLGPPAQGPGNYALGRGLLALGDPQAALDAFAQARAAGFAQPGLARAEGLAHLGLYRTTFTVRLDCIDPKVIADLDARMDRHRQAALALLQQEPGGAGEPRALDEARIAWMRRDYLGCLARCEAAIQAAPRTYEAHQLAAQALYEAAADARYLKGGWERMLREADQNLARAQAIGRSDPSLAIDRLRLLNLLDAHAGGTRGVDSSLAGLRQQQFEQAITLRPEDPEAWKRNLPRLWQEAVGQASRGEDARPKLRGLVNLVDPMRALPNRSSQLGVYYWMLGEEAWRFGADPWPDLDRGLIFAESMGAAELRVVRGRVLAERGRDPEAELDQALALCWSFENSQPPLDYPRALMAECQLVRVRWLASKPGGDPEPALREAIGHLDIALARLPEGTGNPTLLAEARTLEARLDLARGRDPRPALAAALAHAQRAATLRPDRFYAQLILAEAHRAAAACRGWTRTAPEASLARADRALAVGLAANPTDFRLHLAAARVDLDRWAWAKGGPAALRRAVAAALKGLATKGDAPDLWRALAEARRGLGDPAGAEAALAQARRLDPNLSHRLDWDF